MSDPDSLPPDTLPFKDGPFRMALGLTALRPADWIEIDGRYEADMALRRRLLAEHRAETLALLPEAEPAARELLDQFAGFLPLRFPRHFVRDGDRLVNRALDESWDLADPPCPPLELAGRLVQEDLCILTGDPPVLTAGVLCFANRWRLAEKIGRTVAAIHGPVALYADTLERPVDRFISRLDVDRPVQRLNWGLTDDPALYQPFPRRPDPDLRPEQAGDLLFLRVERETLRRLPATGAVLFTIRTYQRPLSALLPAAAARLAGAIRALPEPVARYKGLTGFGAAALGWLDRAAVSAKD